MSAQFPRSASACAWKGPSAAPAAFCVSAARCSEIARIAHTWHRNGLKPRYALSLATSSCDNSDVDTSTIHSWS
eukprot:5687023-Prymnesium_polylepis.1